MRYEKYLKQYIQNAIKELEKNQPKKKNGRITVTSLVKYGFKSKCACCGVKNKLTVDHIIPKSKGGGDDVTNLQILCGKCNLKKSDKIIGLNELRKL